MTIEEQLLQTISRLPEEDKEQVLAFAITLVGAPPRGVPGRALLRFAGSIPSKDLESMEKAIAEGCERIDYNEW